jgi:hypothetical protein
LFQTSQPNPSAPSDHPRGHDECRQAASRKQLVRIRDRTAAGAEPRLAWWLDRIANGWIDNNRVGELGWLEKAEFFGVYGWEYVNVIAPALDKARGGT